jgi:hypothetical protein
MADPPLPSLLVERSSLIPILLVSLVVLVACDSGTVSPTTTPPGVTSTTIENDTCTRLARDTATYLQTLIEVLDQVTVDEIRDREAWPEALQAMEQQGKDLDSRAAEMRCDPGEVQTAAFLAADLDPDSDLARYLLTLMGR